MKREVAVISNGFFRRVCPILNRAQGFLLNKIQVSMDIPRTFHNPAAIRTVDKAHFSRDACSEKSKKVPVLVWDGVETHETVFAKFRQPL
jgi:hypothetical protein